MQELIETMMEEWGEGRGLPEWAETALEKEKDQIVDAFEDGKENGRESMLNIYKYLIGEYYYNQTYNQNK